MKNQIMGKNSYVGTKQDLDPGMMGSNPLIKEKAFSL